MRLWLAIVLVGRSRAESGNVKLAAPMTKHTHCVVQHRSVVSGIEAMTMFSEHSFPRHSHDHYGIGIMTAGAQRSWSVVGEVESEVGDVIMVNPGEMHDGEPLSAARGWKIIYLDPALVMREVADAGTQRELVVRPVARDLELAARVVRLFTQFEAGATDALIVEESLACCLMRVAEHHAIDGGGASHGSPSVLKAVERLKSAPESSVTLRELAALCNLSRFQLLRSFVREVGATPHAYLIQLRVRLARRHLAAGKSIADAANLSGFADQSHMTRAFVRQLGITPGRYRAAIA